MKTYWTFVVAAILVVGCGQASKSPNLVGTWSSSMNGSEMTYHFRSDGTISAENRQASISATIASKYSVIDGKLVTRPESADVQGSGPAAEQLRSMAMQPSKVALLKMTSDDYQLGIGMQSLKIHRTSPSP